MIEASRTHQRMGCPLSTNTLARAVAQLPLPITAIRMEASLMRSNYFFSKSLSFVTTVTFFPSFKVLLKAAKGATTTSSLPFSPVST